MAPERVAQVALRLPVRAGPAAMIERDANNYSSARAPLGAGCICTGLGLLAAFPPTCRTDRRRGEPVMKAPRVPAVCPTSVVPLPSRGRPETQTFSMALDTPEVLRPARAGTVAAGGAFSPGGGTGGLDPPGELPR